VNIMCRTVKLYGMLTNVSFKLLGAKVACAELSAMTNMVPIQLRHSGVAFDDDCSVR
jgi:hypothetical protein